MPENLVDAAPDDESGFLLKDVKRYGLIENEKGFGARRVLRSAGFASNVYFNPLDYSSIFSNIR